MIALLPALVASVAAAGVVLAVMAGYVSRRESSPAGLSLAVLLLAVAWWGLTYAVEISTEDLSARLRWGDWKYVGICLLPPAWLTFCLQYTGRGHRVTRRLLALLAVEPVLVLTLLAVPATHDLVRYYPASSADDVIPIVATGPLFWVHLVYVNIILVGATALFVVRMLRVSRMYRRVAVALVSAALLPWAANLLHNFEVGPFARVDLTPTAFVITGAVLVWGLHRERLVNLTPLARGMVVENMADAVVVLDAFRRVVDANPAAATLLGRRRGDLTGRPWQALVPGNPELAPRIDMGAESAQVETTFDIGGVVHHFDARRQPLRDKVGATAGELIVLRDVTERKAAETRLHELLTERTRIAAALQASFKPAVLPQIPQVELAGLYEPAGDGREIGGDFFDVFPLGTRAWGIVLGDVSGKGAEAAAVTALIRYTLRTLATLVSAPRPPREVLCDLNTMLLRDSTDERYCTLVYAVVTPTGGGGMEVRLCLGGHHPPLVRRHCGEVESVGTLGTALGLIPEPDLAETRLVLGPGDLLCLFTDGLVEARRGHDLFETARASAVLAQTQRAGVQESLAALSSAAREFRGEPLGDDLALLALRVDMRADAGMVAQ